MDVVIDVDFGDGSGFSRRIPLQKSFMVALATGWLRTPARTRARDARKNGTTRRSLDTSMRKVKNDK